MKHTSKGFTIVELLIVIVVIGILAAIVIVAFNGIQNRANDTAVRSDLANAHKSLALSHTLVESYPNTPTQLADTARDITIKPTRSAYHSTGNNFIYCFSGGTGYALVAKSKSGKTFYITNTISSPAEFTTPFPDGQATICPAAGAGGTGSWGTSTGGAWAAWVK